MPSGSRISGHIVRADFNVPVKEGVITDDGRIRAALPTLNNLLDQIDLRAAVELAKADLRRSAA